MHKLSSFIPILASLCPKLLNSQSISWKLNFILGMPRLFGLNKNNFSLQGFVFWTMRSVDLKTKLSSHNFFKKTKRTNLFFSPDDMEILEILLQDLLTTWFKRRNLVVKSCFYSVQKVLAFPKWNWVSKTSIGESHLA